MKNYKKTIQSTAALLTFLLTSTAFSLPIKAQSQTSSINPIIFAAPPPPPNRGGAGQRNSAASRGCADGMKSVIAMAPDYEETIDVGEGEKISVTKVWGLTTDDYPTFRFFVPYKKSSITQMEFVIQDKSQKRSQTIYRTQLNKPEQPGIIKVSTKGAIQPLQTSKTKHQKIYNWFLKVKIKCGSEQPEQLQTVEGWIERIKPSSTLTESLDKATPIQQAAIYAKNGIWQNALNVLAEARIAKPQDTALLTAWTNLLKSEQLDNLTKYSFVDCCEVEK